MSAIKDFIIFLSLFSISTDPLFVLANVIPIHQFGDSITPIESDDHKALLAIKTEISDDPDSALSSWNSSLHFCQWRGVTCGARHRRRVLVLDLSSSKLSGTLSPFVGNLTFLHELNLHNNSFRGEIPHQISHLPRLNILTLSMNSFGGEIPANLSRCSQLSDLNLRSNMLVGRIPAELASLPNLIDYGLGGNYLIGRLQDIEIGNMSSQSLQVISLYDNLLQGIIPDDVGSLKGLLSFDIGYNNIGGTIPDSVFNLSSLWTLYLTNNPIQGHLPQDLGLRLPQLRSLQIWNMSLVGQVPASLSNLSDLQVLDLSYNSFTGSFSLIGNNMPYLSYLSIAFSYPLRGLGRDLSFLDTLTNCTSLTALYLGGNSFIGEFPRSILNLSTSLQWLGLDDNRFLGQLPSGLGKFVNLYGLLLYNNHFTGLIPPDVGMLESLEHLVLDYNNFTGEVPSSLGNLTLLSELSMTYNNLDGPLPKNLANCKFLQILSLSCNRFSGVIPAELFAVSNLIHLEIGQNQLQGSIPAGISGLKILFWLDVSHNKLSGEIPGALSSCMSLAMLNMSQNSFIGSIPESLSPLESIQTLDLSYNDLSGQIPDYFSTWPYLLSLNLSFNNLNGEVPVKGVFASTTGVSVVGNSELCGGVPQLHLPNCPSQSHRGSKRRRLSLSIIVIISIACVMFVVLSVALCSYFLFPSRKRKNTLSGLLDIEPLLEVSYQDLSRATKGFSLSNLIGAGGFGSVYRGILQQDDKDLTVAVKVINLQNEGAGSSFIAECNAFRNIRHRNLVKIITVCSSIDTQRNEFKALVYEFMPNGSLEDWLYPSLVTGDNQYWSLSLFQRLSIVADVAFALEYLHNGCASSMVHCDLKPTNILLDDEMIAHVGDFGLAKFLSGATASSQSSSTQVRGTVGYAAPEYGLGSSVSVEGDVYSFGIVVLEMMIAKKPTDPMFSDGLNLHDFAKSALPDRVLEIIDQRMLDDAIMSPTRTGADIRIIECITSLIMIGVQCSQEPPRERMSIKDAVNELKSVKAKTNK